MKAAIIRIKILQKTWFWGNTVVYYIKYNIMSKFQQFNQKFDLEKINSLIQQGSNIKQISSELDIPANV